YGLDRKMYAALQGRDKKQTARDLIPSHRAQKLVQGVPQTAHPREPDERVVSAFRQVHVSVDYFLQESLRSRLNVNGGSPISTLGGIGEACHHYPQTLHGFVSTCFPACEPFQNPCGNGINTVELFQVAKTFEIDVRGHNPGGLVFQRSGYVRRVERVVAEFPGPGRMPDARPSCSPDSTPRWDKRPRSV